MEERSDNKYGLPRHQTIQGPYDTLPTTRTCQSMSPSLVHIIRLKEKH
jgi:hypothetical protein